MTIREMNNSHIAETTRLDEAAFTKAWSEKTFDEELKKDYSYYFIYEEDGKIIGYAGIWCIYETAELIRIAVLPEFRGKGIAKALMQEILACAKEKGCCRMLLEVRKGNESADALYRGAGFKEISVRPGYYDGEDALIMEKPIV